MVGAAVLATLTFIAASLLGFLAYNISGRRIIGIIITVTAALTPVAFRGEPVNTRSIGIPFRDRIVPLAAL